MWLIKSHLYMLFAPRYSAMLGCLTSAVAVMCNLDLESSKAGVPVKFAVVSIGFPVTATHRALMRFTLLRDKQTQTEREMIFMHK